MRNAWLWTAAIVIAIAGASYALYLYLVPAPLPRQVVYGNGHIEGTEVRVAAEIAGRIIESNLVEGRRVSQGDKLVRLDDTDLRLELDSIKAEIAALGAERKRAASEMSVWRHHLRMAERDLGRYRELREKNTVTQQRAEQAENTFQEARGRVAALESEMAAIEKRIVAATARRELAENRIAKTQVPAPVGGTVLVKAVEPGEYVQVGQTVAVLVDLSRVELKVYVPERDVGKVKLGDPARVRIDAFPGRHFESDVARVDPQAQFTPRDIHLPDERVRMVFGVTLAIQNPDGTLKPGMPADAWILWQSDSGWPDRLFVPQ